MINKNRTKMVLAIATAVIVTSPFLVSCRQSEKSKPKIAVLFVIDQLRSELITMHSKHFTGGFGRLLSEGAYFEKAFHDHGISNSAPGHATINTGMHPKNHGIVDNAWAEENYGWVVNSNNRDSSASILGDPAAIGASAKNRLEDNLS